MADTAPDHRTYMRALLDDLEALGIMIEEGWLERGAPRIGAEQELFLVDRALEPAPVAPEVLARTRDPRITVELARYNLECNLTVQPFEGDCLRRMEEELAELVLRIREAAAEVQSSPVLCGILPTLQQSDLILDNITPEPRYRQLNDAAVGSRGGGFHVRIKGIDELDLVHDNVMLESCNTSFQIHLQIEPDEFVRQYNLAQAISAPVMACAVNSPLLLGRRLWQETRVPLFQASVDGRPDVHRARGQRARVRFGDGWLSGSILDLFRENVLRYPIQLSSTRCPRSTEMVRRGEVPALKALQLHNGTVYRWNRSCYGVLDGRPHLRIENRVLPSGPTVIDQMANTAFFLGLMSGLQQESHDLIHQLSFADANANFISAARTGLRSQLTWLGGQQYPSARLILDVLLPRARAGLLRRKVNAADADRLLDVVAVRVERGITGSSWALNSLEGMTSPDPVHQRLRALTAAMLRHQTDARPISEWELATMAENPDWRDGYRRVGQFMTTDLFTVQPDALLDLVASIMDWQKVRHVPVEDAEGRLLGVVSYRALIRLLGHSDRDRDGTTAEKMMIRDPITVTAKTPTLEALAIMRENNVGCLPVVDGERLIGIITTRDLLDVSERLFEEQLAQRYRDEEVVRPRPRPQAGERESEAGS